jgi:hypothetical protein
MNKTLLRKTVVGGVALLSLGVASPAFATGGTTPPTSTAGAVTTAQPDSTLTVDQLKAAIDAKITARLAALTSKLAALTTSPPADMTADEIAAKQALIVILQTKLTTLKNAVDGATTIPAVQQALQDYWAPSLTELQARVNVMITHQLAELDEQLAKVPTSSLSDTQKTAATAALNAKKQKLTDLQKQVAAAQSVAGVQAALKAAGVGDGRHKKQHDGARSWTMDTKHGKKDQGRHGGGLGLGLGLGQGLGNAGGFGGHDFGQAGHGH